MALIPKGNRIGRNKLKLKLYKTEVKKTKENLQRFKTQKKLRKLTDNFLVIVNFQIAKFVTCTGTCKLEESENSWRRDIRFPCLKFSAIFTVG